MSKIEPHAEYSCILDQTLIEFNQQLPRFLVKLNESHLPPSQVSKGDSPPPSRLILLLLCCAVIQKKLKILLVPWSRDMIVGQGQQKAKCTVCGFGEGWMNRMKDGWMDGWRLD